MRNPSTSCGVWFIGHNPSLLQQCCLLSHAAKDLIRGLLKTDPKERYKIEDVLRHPWIAVCHTRACVQLHCTRVYTSCHLYVSTVWLPTTQGYQKVPETPLASCQVLRDEAEVWMDVQVGLLYTLRAK